MSIIQQIREKYAPLVIVLIALSLVAFILMDAFVGRSRMGGSKSSEVGVINGKSVDIMEFERKVKLQEDMYQQQGMQVNDVVRSQIVEYTWGQLVEEKLLKEELNKLGLTIGAKELNDILFGANPPAFLAQQFVDPNTGAFDVNTAKQFFAQLKKKPNDPNTQYINTVYIQPLLDNTLRNKYMSLLGHAAYVPKWLAEKQMADNSTMADISLVAIPYTTVADSTVKVSDTEIMDYVKKHKELYKQKESRSISYVSFDASATLSDSAEVLNQIVALKDEFTTTSDLQGFFARNLSAIDYYDGYVLKSKVNVPNSSEIIALSTGEVYGPYLDGGNYTLAKMVEKKTLPDSVKCRHILISTQQGLDDSTAKKRVDSIAAAIKSGAPFAAMALQYSDDPGSKEKGGEYEFGSMQMGQLAKEFADAIFYGKSGDKKVVKTQFGYHYIEVMNQKNFEPAYKVAYFAKEILPSVETENSASALAMQFASESRTLEAFNENLKKRNLNKLVAVDLKQNDYQVPGIGMARQLVKWVYEADKGEVSEPYNIGDAYIVATITNVNKEGLPTAEAARPLVENQVRMTKKFEKISAAIKDNKSLEAIAAMYNLSVLTAKNLAFNSTFIPEIGGEPRTLGAAFNKENQQGISSPIKGNTGVFVLKVDQLVANPNPAVDLNQNRNAMIQQTRSMIMYRSFESLKKAATIKDNRSLFY